MATVSSLNDLDNLKELDLAYNSVIRPGGALLLEQHEEWITGKRYFSEQSMAQLWIQDGTTEKSKGRVVN